MQTKTIEETREFLEDMAEELNALAEMDQMEMYRMLTEVGNEIPAIAAEEKNRRKFRPGLHFQCVCGPQRGGRTYLVPGIQRSHGGKGLSINPDPGPQRTQYRGSFNPVSIPGGALRGSYQYQGEPDSQPGQCIRQYLPAYAGKGRRNPLIRGMRRES
jgi:hypothetical protein